MARGVKPFSIDTPAGRIWYIADRPTPPVMLLHGFLREPHALLSLRDVAPDAGAFALPGHEGADVLSPISMRTWVDAFSSALSTWPAPPLLIGESLGGTLALALPAKGVLALDPPISTHHLWSVQVGVRRVIESGGDLSGVLDVFSESFSWVLDRISAPSVVLASDEPLLPPRNAERAPSVLDDGDFAALASHPKVQAYRVAGGHALIDDNPTEVVAALRCMLSPGRLNDLQNDADLV